MSGVWGSSPLVLAPGMMTLIHSFSAYVDANNEKINVTEMSKEEEKGKIYCNLFSFTPPSTSELWLVSFGRSSVFSQRCTAWEQEIILLTAALGRSLARSHQLAATSRGGDSQGRRLWIVPIFTYITRSWAQKINYATNCFRQACWIFIYKLWFIYL